MTEPNKSRGYSRLVLLAVALLLPAISLIPLGSLWLWQHGYILYWALASCVVVGVVYYLQKRLIVPLPPTPDDGRCRCGRPRRRRLDPAPSGGMGRRHSVSPRR